MTTIYDPCIASENKPITERVKSFEDACRILKMDSIKIGIEGLPNDAKSIVAYSKLVIIARALNEGWEPDWSNTNQYKYYPWFKHVSGFGLSCVVCAAWHTFTHASSRLCFKNAALATYAGKQFAELYRDFLEINS